MVRFCKLEHDELSDLFSLAQELEQGLRIGVLGVSEARRGKKGVGLQKNLSNHGPT